MTNSKSNRIYRDIIIFSVIAIFLIEVFHYLREVLIGGNILAWIIGATVAFVFISYIFRRAGNVYTESESVKEDLEFEAQQFKSIFDSIDGIIYIADIETYELLYANGAFRKRFGEDVVGKSCYEIFKSDRSSPCNFCTNDRIYENGVIQPSYGWDFQSTSDGRWYRCIDKAIRWPDGRAVRFGIAIDITDYREAQEALRSSEEKYRMLVERANDGIVVIQDQVIKFASNKFLETYNFEKNTVLGKDIRELIAPESREDIMERYNGGMAGKNGPDIHETRLIDGNGIAVDVEINDSLVDYEGRKAVLVTVRDITERKRLEKKRSRLQDQLARSEKLATVGRLISGAAHELNNPLAVVIGHSELLQSKLEKVEGKGVRKNLSAILDGAERISEIVSKLLSFAREERFDKVEVDVNQVLLEALSLREKDIRALKINVARDFVPIPPKVMGSPDKLRQVFLNIVLNSEQAMEKGENPRNLTVRSSVVKNKVKVDIEDTGPGISKENLERIFDPFFTTREVGQGSGLGLSMCYGVVKEHGGEIRVESEPGNGARFVVELPLIKESVNPSARVEFDQSIFRSDHFNWSI